MSRVSPQNMEEEKTHQGLNIQQDKNYFRLGSQVLEEENESPIDFVRHKKDAGDLSLKLSKWAKNKVGGALGTGLGTRAGESTQNFDNSQDLFITKPI